MALVRRGDISWIQNGNAKHVLIIRLALVTENLVRCAIQRIRCLIVTARRRDDIYG